MTKKVVEVLFCAPSLPDDPFRTWVHPEKLAEFKANHRVVWIDPAFETVGA